jgi:trehalose-6-phosphate hydrolase
VLRKKYAVISEGSYEPYAEDHPRVLAFTRTFGNDRLLVLANFYGEETMIQIPPEFVGGSIVIANYEDRKAVATNRVVMRPYEAITIWQR